MPEKLTIDRARSLVERIVERKGADFVYNPGGGGVCSYAPISMSHRRSDDHKTTTGCLVGAVLTEHGETRHKGFQGRVNALAREYPDMMDKKTVQYLYVVQRMQDRGFSWGDAAFAGECHIHATWDYES